MPNKQTDDDGKCRDRPPIERTDKRSSPGSGEEDAAADIQPGEVENGTAR